MSWFAFYQSSGNKDFSGNAGAGFHPNAEDGAFLDNAGALAFTLNPRNGKKKQKPYNQIEFLLVGEGCFFPSVFIKRRIF